MKGKILKLHDMLVSGKITATELTQKYLDYIKTHDGDINAYTCITEKEALKRAAETDKKIAAGEKIDVLCGIPMTIKDCISTKGITTSCGSKMLNNYKPVYNAFAYEQLDDKGAVLLGKTNMDEFAMGSTCETSYYGPTKNPHDINRVPGGSSGGGAAAAAADMAVYALGSDTGGSVRQPASFCGIVGLKPTYGAVSRWGLVAYGSSLDQIGVLASSVEDTSIVFDAISKYDEKDATCENYERKPSFNELEKDIKGLKIGVLSNLFEGLNPEIDKAMKDAIKSFEDMGAIIENITIDQFELSLPVYYILACAEASSNLSRYDGVRYGHRCENFLNTEEMICKTRDEGFGREVKRRIMLGNYVLSSGYFDAYYKKAEIMREVIKKNFSKAFEQVDMLLCPTVAQTAFGIGELMNCDPVEMYLTDMCTVPVNIAQLPAISIPCGYDKNDMPIGLQLIGDKFTENKLLNAAYKFEEKNHEIMYRKPKIGGECIEF